MARPKEFDRETALQKAIQVFAEHGYEGSSTQMLLQGMSISRQSMYDTFGDKHRLYLQALQQYSAESVGQIIRNLNSHASPLKSLETALLEFASRPASQPHAGCLGISSICEFGQSDPQITLLTETMSRTLSSALERRLAEAQAAQEIDTALNPRDAAQFISATLSGIRIASRSGAPLGVLNNIAHMALRSLR